MRMKKQAISIKEEKTEKDNYKGLKIVLVL